MTKMKSKKMTKSTFAIIIMAIAMVAMLAFGGTYAYFTAQTTAKSDSVQTGKITLTTKTALSLVDGPVVSGEDVLTAPIVYTNNSTVASYIFVTFTAQVANDAQGTGAVTADVIEYDVDDSVWTALDANNNPGVYYVLADEAAEFTKDFTVTSSIKVVADNNYVEGSFDDATSDDIEVEGKYIIVSVEAESIQVILEDDGTTEMDAATAYGKLTAAN